MTAYKEKPLSSDYKVPVSGACRALLNRIVSPGKAMPYAICGGAGEAKFTVGAAHRPHRGTCAGKEGVTHVLTIIARGYSFHGREGNILPEPRDYIEYARRALCAWCSVPDGKKAAPKEERQIRSESRELHREFPELVEKLKAALPKGVPL